MASQYFTPRETVIRKLPDGREIQVAVAGVPISLADAIHYEILSDQDFINRAIIKPPDYGTRYLGVKLADTPGASQLTTSARGTVVHAQVETDPASRTTTVTPIPTQTDAGAASTGGGTETGGAAGATSTAGTGERTASR